MPGPDIVRQVKLWLFVTHRIFHDFESTLSVAVANVHLSPLTVYLTQLVDGLEFLKSRLVIDHIRIFKFFVLIVE